MSTSSKVCIALSGLLFIIAGIMCLSSAEATLLSLAWILGFFTLLSGILSLFFYLKGFSVVPGSGYVLIAAIADIIMGIIFLANQVFVAAAIPFVFAAWILVAGILSITHSFEFKKKGFPGWHMLLIFGILTVLFAICSFVDPAISAFTITFMVGFALITRGVNRFIFLAGIKKIL